MVRVVVEEVDGIIDCVQFPNQDRYDMLEERIWELKNRRKCLTNILILKYKIQELKI